ncbi:MAG: hypothetical protein IKF91_02805, partial [Bacilli bacterium]|nr:hypothetical protein [Bacilli bacterium]
MKFRLFRERKYSSAIPLSRWELLRRRIIAGIGSVAFASTLGFGMPSVARAEVSDTGDNVSIEQVNDSAQAEAQRQAEEAAAQAEAQRQADEAAAQAEAQRQA